MRTGKDHKLRLWDNDNEVFSYVDFADIDTFREILDLFENYFYTDYFKDVPPQQFANCWDKNGTDIHEGDYVKIKAEYYLGDHYQPEYISEVTLENGCFSVTGDAQFEMLCINPYYWEVIGNVHQNPELKEQCLNG